MVLDSVQKSNNVIMQASCLWSRIKFCVYSLELLHSDWDGEKKLPPGFNDADKSPIGKSAAVIIMLQVATSYLTLSDALSFSFL